MSLNISQNKFDADQQVVKNTELEDQYEELIEETKNDEEMENGANASAILFGEVFDKNFKASEIDYNLQYREMVATKRHGNWRPNKTVAGRLFEPPEERPETQAAADVA